MQLVKKTLMGRFELFWTHQEIHGRKSFLVANPNKGHAGKRKIKYADHLRDVSTGDNKCTSAWTQMNLRHVYKIITLDK